MKKQVYAHFLTWFNTKEFSGKWRMWESKYEQNPHNPDTILYNGKRDIASISYPLTGPYDSTDPDIIEYQFLLMKLCGIDGIIVDWDGPYINSYRHENFIKILPYLKKFKLKLIMCFEEWSGYWPIGKYKTRDEELKQGIKNIEYMMKTFSTKDFYGLVDGKKPVLIFRKIPEKWYSADEWQILKKKIHDYNGIVLMNDCYDPQFINSCDGYFYWVGGFDSFTLANTLEYYQLEHENYVAKVKEKANSYFFDSVMPGFNDSPVWGWGQGARIAPRYEGARYEKAWDNVIKNQPDLVQIVTWNDWNEGSQIEPSDSYGFQYIKMTAEYIHKYKKTNKCIEEDKLELPLELFRLRKAKGDNEKLNIISNMLLEGNYSEAKKLIIKEKGINI